MSTSTTTAADGKGKAFFDRADQVAETGNWDYAIEMYLQGIAKEPGNIERGHEKLRQVSLRRKAQGGKGAGFLEAMKRKKPGKDHLDNLINAEWLMSRDPGSDPAWRSILTAAKTLQMPDLVRWGGQVLFEINRTSRKPSRDTYVFLINTYAEAKLYTEARQACQAALAVDPQNVELQDRLGRLSAEETMQRGKYDQEGSFEHSVVDIKSQVNTFRGDQLSQDERFRLEQVEKARAAYEAEPAVAGKVNALVEALLRFGDEAYENQAIDVLNKAYNESQTYRYKVRIGDIRMRQMKRRYQKLVHAGDAEAARELVRAQLAFELQEYADRAANYPTDLSLKYELGRRQYIAQQYDEAISSLQQARRDPKHRLHALNLLGMAFFRKGWNTEAAETLEQALKGEQPEARRKELLYNLGQVYQAMGRVQDALEKFSAVAQVDFNYKDARTLIEQLRRQARPDDAAAAGQ